MTSLINSLRRTIADHVQIASAEDIIAITSTLCGSTIEPATLGHATVRVLPRFEVNGDVVTDALTGLMWTRAVITGGKRNWQAACQAASEVRIGGFTDWRAPTMAERLAINDYTRSEPALDTSVFISESSGWEWTSTVYAPSPGGCAWYVYFSYGGSYWGYQTFEGFVRAVRAGQIVGTLA